MKLKSFTHTKEGQRFIAMITGIATAIACIVYGLITAYKIAF